MDFDYIATGTIKMGGCSSATIKYNVLSQFSLGQTVYNKKKARLGIYRKHTIKEIRGFPFQIDPFNGRMCKFCNFPPLYIDTYNQLHNEDDLVSYDDAVDLVNAALLEIAADLETKYRDHC